MRANRCGRCGADYAEFGTELWEASQRAAEALGDRQAVLDRVPVIALDAVAASVPPVASAPSIAVPSATPEQASSATVQSVLAIAGAGLVAVAAVVFAFFNPDLAGSGVRAAILAPIAAAFLGAAVVLVRRELRFSAEAVGGLGLVFTALTVAASIPLLPAALDPWVAIAIATLAGAWPMALLAIRLRLRVWLWSSLIALAFVPRLLGSASPEPAGAIAGTLTAAAAAAALVAWTVRLRSRVGTRLTAEIVTLTVLQAAFAVVALIQSVYVPGIVPTAPAFIVSASALVVAMIAVASARRPAGGFWSFVAGGSAVLSAVTATVGVFAERVPSAWLWALVPSAAVATLVTIGAARPLHRRVRAPYLFGGAVAAVGTAAAPPTAIALVALITVVSLGGRARTIAVDPVEPPIAVAMAALALGLGVFAWTTRATREGRGPGRAGAGEPGPAPSSTEPAAKSAALAPRPMGTAWLGTLGQWYGVLALLLAMALPAVPPGAGIALGLVLGVALAVVATRTPVRAAGLTRRLPVVIGAHLVVLLAAALSWQHPETTVWAGIGAVGAIAVLAGTVPASARFVHTGIGFAYALVVLATGLGRADVAEIAVLSLTTSAAGVVAIVATFQRRVPPRSWGAILAVTAVPFVVGVALVLVERSGWTALSTGVILLLALALTVTRRAGLGTSLRAVAASLVVPSASVVAVCLGAQFLETSGSPAVLPVVAVLVAIMLPSTTAIRAALEPRVGARDAAAVRLAIEGSSLAAAVIAVVLALAREAAGAPTSLVVLLVLGVGFAVQAHSMGRRYGWWLAGAAFSGALWSLWSLIGVSSVEAHLLPPALAAALIAVVRTARGARATWLFAAGLLAAIVPLLLVLAVAGSGAAYPWRAYGLIAAALALVGVGTLLGRTRGERMRRLDVLRPAILTVVIVAAAAAPIEGARWGLGLDAAPATPAVAWALGLGVVAAAAAATAARMLRTGAPAGSRLRTTRWLAAPAVLTATVGVWPTIESDWSAIWIMWALLLALLIVMVVAADRALRGGRFLPPVWFLFAVAFVTAVVAWSPRELRVEWFSLPLGSFLVLAGTLGLRAAAGGSGGELRSLPSWPAGRAGSWPLLAPGIVVTLSASVAATYTDPQTWRAILVMVLALAAILVGASLRLAAPFVLGVVVLPIENLLAFLVQIGRGIESMPWWITLSVVGAVLLIIAVTYERRAGESAGFAARLGDLR
ncbi:SCO7613 C-terminal domain-containing membrane protein [Agromyces rhizosphaerae]|uniref:SCO7613 C-terminal domain-containing membrane protein n=1 Tax=Agromyces rhizosphaerae TaxID=88374 RepID=UPI00248FCE8A|nr:hypothetical protein [Agromyces rhizosphaerae]